VPTGVLAARITARNPNHSQPPPAWPLSHLRSGRENRLVDSEPKKLYHSLPVLYVTGVQVRAPAAG
jgi:hypothetical protein